LPPIHAGGVFLSDIAPLGKGHAVQFDGIAFQPEQIDDFRAFGHAQSKAVRQIGLIHRHFTAGRQPAIAQFRKARISGSALLRRQAPMHGQIIARDGDGAAQAIHRQAFDHAIGLIVRDIQQQVGPVGPNDEIRDHLALRRQQRGIGWQRAQHDILRHQPLQEFADIFLRVGWREADYGAGGEVSHDA
jgi:hypothetical protein